MTLPICGLENNAENTKYIIMSHRQNSGQNRNIRISNKLFKNVTIFKYSETTREMGINGVNWMQPAQNSVWWQASGSVKKVGYSLISRVYSRTFKEFPAPWNEWEWMPHFLFSYTGLCCYYFRLWKQFIGYKL